MSEMLERVIDVLVSDGCGTSDQCEATARRIFAALREPTEGMMKAGDPPYRFHPSEMRELWQTMLDAAAKEGG